MNQDAKNENKNSVLQGIKKIFTPHRKRDAQLLDDMRTPSEISPDSEPPAAPPGDFQKIMAEMERRGITPEIRRELKIKRGFHRAGKLVQKPAVIMVLVVMILAGTSAGVAAKKAYNYRVREKKAGESGIVWNNDQYVMTEEDGLSIAYSKIEESLDIKPMKIMIMPFEMKFSKLDIQEGNATIIFDYGKKKFGFIQAKIPITASNSVESDRKECIEVYNSYLKKTFIIEKNSLPSGEIELSTGINLEGAYYYLSGILTEKDFVEIVENLSF